MLLFAVAVRAQTVQPTPPHNPAQNKRPHVATMRAADSSDGSRVSLTSDQSMGDYEAYRRGDRFYVRIPSTEVSGGRVARGRGFEDAKVQRNGDDTVLSFRLQPGATARVEQRSNQLEVVFRAAGPAPSTGATSSPPRPDGPSYIPPPGPGPTPNDRNAQDHSASRANSVNPLPNITPPVVAATAAKATPSPTPNRASSSPANRNSQAQSSAPAVAASSPASRSNQAPSTGGLNLKGRVRYLMLLASLNPIPLSTAVLLLALIVILFFQRRRTRDTRRLRPSKKKVEAKTPAVIVEQPPVSPPAIETLGAPAMNDMPQALPNGDRDGRVASVSEEVKRVLGGEDFDRGVIGAGDAATRQLVASELLSALASRNGTRHDRAREIFMNHGYFEDATRDLRIADSPAERASAARRLSFVHDREATPHLAAALQDSAPEVRRAAVEALLDQGDPVALTPLHELLRVETDRNVPHTLIRRAIDACTTSGTEPETTVTATPPPVQTFAPPPEEFHPEPDEEEREVIEI